LGTRQQRDAANWAAPRSFGVVPDFLVEGTETAGSLLVDAKYKGRFADTSRRVSEADVYEALAFSKAFGVPRVLLLYPRAGSLSTSAVGTHDLFEKITVGATQVWAADVEVRGIASTGALATYSNNLRRCLVSVSHQMVATSGESATLTM
jgi:5-methylcytosine-specific restriction endonuclease McrBC regulatory subunit McrC